MAEITLSQALMCQLIAEAIEEDGLTQAEFARRVGCTPKHANQVLNGKAFAAPATLDFWAFVLGRRWSIELLLNDGDASA
jgi:transcriptional regulator with XRE-family HTH domain